MKIKDIDKIKTAIKAGKLTAIKLAYKGSEAVRELVEYSIECEQWEIYKFLCDNCEYGQKAELDACKQLLQRKVWIALGVGDIKKAEILMENGGSLMDRSVNFYPYRKSFLERACEYGQYGVVKFLVENGVDVNANNDCALVMACEKHYWDIVEYLVENGADIHANDEQAFRYACSHGHLEMVEYLVENGANIYAMNGQALELAIREGHGDVIAYLKDKGVVTPMSFKDAKREMMAENNIGVIMLGILTFSLFVFAAIKLMPVD